jgi:hypothetical protein
MVSTCLSEPESQPEPVADRGQDQNASRPKSDEPGQPPPQPRAIATAQ